MSLNADPLAVSEVIDRRVNINNHRVYGILKGGSEVSWQPFPSTSFNNSQVQITANPPSQDIVINRKVYVQMQFSLAFTGPAPALGNLVQYGSNDAPRCFPIAQVLNTLQVTVNNDQVSTNLNQYWQALLRYHNWKEKLCDFSPSPSMLDQFQSYDQGLGSTRNPLGLYADSSSMSDEPRGDFSGLTVLTNTPTTSTATLVVTEPVWLSPFIFGHGEQSGFIGIQNMSFTFTLGNLQRIWSHAPGGNALTSLTVNLTGASVFLNYITPNILERIPRALSWPYFELTPYPTTAGSALAAGASTTMTLNSVQLKSIPRRMYIFARMRDQDLQAPLTGMQQTDTFARINSVTLTWDNRVGLLSTATIQDLFQMSTRNGLDISWNQWNKWVGSVHCVEFGTDIGLAPNQASGVIGNYQFGAQVNITNLHPTDAITFALYAVTCNEGTYSVINQSAMHMIGVISPSDILRATSAGPGVSYDSAKTVYGGDFFGDIWSGIKKGATSVYDAAKHIVPVAREVIPVVRDVKSLFGMGQSGGRRRRVMRGRRRGRALIGGAAISRDALAERLMGSGLQEEKDYTEDEQSEQSDLDYEGGDLAGSGEESEREETSSFFNKLMKGKRNYD